MGIDPGGGRAEAQEKGDDEEEEGEDPPWRRAFFAGDFSRPLVFATNRLGHGRDPGDDAAVIVAGLEAGGDLLGDNAPGKEVGETPLKAVADLDAHLALGLGDEEERPVVFPLLADLPALRDLEGSGLDGLPGNVGEDEDRQLGRVAGLEAGEKLLQLLLGGGRKKSGLVGDVTVGARDLQGCRRQR